MEVQSKSLTEEEIFENCFNADTDYNQALFITALSLLLEDGLLIRSTNSEDEELFTPTGTEMDDIDDFVDLSKVEIEIMQLKKSIMGSLTKKTIFNSIVLYCQFDKSNQQGLFIVNQIKKMLDENLLPVIFVIGDNLSSLMDQTIDGFHRQLCSGLGIESDMYEGLMCLKSAENIRVQDINNYIDSYDMDHLRNRSKKKPPPIILALNNPVQLRKILSIHKDKIVEPLMENSNSRLRAVFDFDEFDKVYRSARPMVKPILVDNPLGVYSVLGVTGSHDDICEDCSEWATSKLVRVEVNAEKEKNYRGIHHSDAVIHLCNQPNSLSNNAYALNIISSKLSSFKEAKVNPRNGKRYYPKTIILADHRIVAQRSLATKLLGWGFHVILQNENNLKVCLYNSETWIGWSIRKKVVRDELYKMFNKFNMWDGPVVLIGNKKLDRGLGYHYAPPVDGAEGLIWTNEIMGNIRGNANRIQKVARLHGVIAQCIDYPEELHFWLDERTSLTVQNENAMIHSLNDGYTGHHSLEERLDYARKVTKLLKKERNYLISVKTFRTSADAIEWFHEEKKRLRIPDEYRCTRYGLYLADAIDISEHVDEGTDGITKMRYRGKFMDIMDDKVIRDKDDIGQGANDTARITPVFSDGIIRFVVIYVENPKVKVPKPASESESPNPESESD